MAWYYHLNETTVGPVEADEMKRLLHQGTIQTDTLVWSEGMAQWTPFRNSPVADSGPVIAGASQKCAECGMRFPESEMLHYENSWVCSSCKPIFFQRVKEGVVPRGAMNWASVGRRFVAIFVDGILTMVVGMILLIPFYIELFHQIVDMRKHPGVAPQMHMSIAMNIYSTVISYGMPAAYEIFFIGAYGATLGKMLMKIRVVSPEGQRISYGRATGRYFAKIISGLILLIGYLMAFWDDEKRALHDRICDTRVINSES